MTFYLIPGCYMGNVPPKARRGVVPPGFGCGQFQGCCNSLENFFRPTHIIDVLLQFVTKLCDTRRRVSFV